MECDQYQQNLEKCNCTYDPCERKGHCCQCIEYHHKLNQLPACYFPADVESTYDRSIAMFIRCQQK